MKRIALLCLLALATSVHAQPQWPQKKRSLPGEEA